MELNEKEIQELKRELFKYRENDTFLKDRTKYKTEVMKALCDEMKLKEENLNRAEKTMINRLILIMYFKGNLAELNSRSVRPFPSDDLKHIICVKIRLFSNGNEFYV